MQHLSAEQSSLFRSPWWFPHKMAPALGTKFLGQAKDAQVFGAFVAVVQGLGPAVGAGAAGGGAAGAAVVQGFSAA
jgi:hypothetical protein